VSSLGVILQAKKCGGFTLSVVTDVCCIYLLALALYEEELDQIPLANLLKDASTPFTAQGLK
jgi:hypothetical protein